MPVPHAELIGKPTNPEGDFPSQKTWQKLDKVISIHEFKSDGKNILSERYIDLELESNSFFISRNYNNGNLIFEEKNENKGSKRKSIYENDLIKEQHEFINEVCVNKTLFTYENDLLIDEITIAFFGEIDYESFRKILHYNSDRELIKTEHYGLFNSIMVLYFVEEVIHEYNYGNHKIIFKSGGVYKDDFGYYSLDELNKIRKENFNPSNENDGLGDLPMSFEDIAIKKSRNKNNFINNNLMTDSRDKTFIGFEKYNEKYYDNINLVTKIYLKKVYENKKIFQETSYNSENDFNLVSRFFYHYEYNDKSLLEMELCFQLLDEDLIENISTKKFYY